MKWLIVLSVIAVAGGGVVPNEAISDTTAEPESQHGNMCRQYGGEEAYERAVGAEHDFDKCIESALQNVSRESVEEAMENDILPDLLNSYCSRAQDTKHCLSNFTYRLGGCMPLERREGFDFGYNRIPSAAIDYVCWENGRRMVQFLTTGGRDCWVSKRPALKQCLGNELEEISVEEWGQRGFKATPEDCRLFKDARDCIIHVLQSCPQPTPAIEMGGLLNHMYGILPCAITQVENNV